MKAETSPAPGARIDHGADEVVIVLAFIDEAAAVAGDCDDAGFGAVDQVEEASDAAVVPFDQRDWESGRSVGKAILDRGIEVFRQPKCIAGVALRGRRRMHRVGSEVLEVTARAILYPVESRRRRARRRGGYRCGFPAVAVPRSAPAMRPFSFTRLTAGEDAHSGMLRSRAVRNSRAASALPLTRRVPRPCTSTSRPCASIREATKAADLSERVALRKCFRSGPLFSPMPMNVNFRIGCASMARSVPSLRPSNGSGWIDRPSSTPPG